MMRVRLYVAYAPEVDWKDVTWPAPLNILCVPFAVVWALLQFLYWMCAPALDRICGGSLSQCCPSSGDRHSYKPLDAQARAIVTPAHCDPRAIVAPARTRALLLLVAG